MYVDYNQGDDSNDGAENTPKKTIQNALDSVPDGTTTVNIKVITVSRENISVPTNKGIEKLTVESVDSLQTIYGLVANGIETEVKDITVYKLIGGGYNEDIHGDTSIKVSGVNHIVTVHEIVGGGEASGEDNTATVFGNTNVYVDNFTVTQTRNAHIIGGGIMADVRGNTNIQASGSHTSASTTAQPAVLGGGYIPSTSNGTFKANVYGDTNIDVSDGNYGYITGNTNRENKSPQHLQTTENIVDGKVNIKVKNIQLGEVFGNSRQILSGNTGNTVERSYGSYKVNKGVNISVVDSHLTESSYVTNKMALGNARGLRAASWIENGDSYTGGPIDVLVDGQSTIQGIFLGDIIDSGSPKAYANFLGGQAEINGNISLNVNPGSKITMIQSLSTANNKTSFDVVASRDVWAKINGNIDINVEGSGVSWTVGSLSTRVNVPKENLVLNGNLSYNYKDLTSPVKSIIAGFEYTGTQKGDLSLTLDNVYGDYAGDYIDLIASYGDGNGTTNPSLAAIDLTGNISYDFKNTKADVVYLGSRIGKTVSNGNVNVKLQDSQITSRMILGHYNQADTKNKSILNGDVSFIADGPATNIKSLTVGSRVYYAGRNAENNGNADIKLLGGQIETLHASGASSNTNAFADFNGDIDIYVGKNASFIKDTSSIYAAQTTETKTNGNKKLTLENGTIVANMYNKIYPFTEIILGNTLEITNELQASTDNASELNILGSWHDGDTLVAAKDVENPNDPNDKVLPVLDWFVQNWGPEPIMRFELNGNYDGNEYLGRWYIEGSRILHTVNFESNGGTAVDSIVDISDGSTINAPVEPTKDGYKFDGWYKDVDLKTPWDFTNDTVNSDITLYAKWTKEGSGGGGGGGVVDPPVNPPVPSNVVILASGEKYTDVLTATVLANEKKCSILLTQKYSVTEETLNEIKRLNVDTVIISGGPASVSEKVVDQLSDYKVIRLAGEDRYETARKVGDEVRFSSGNNNQAMLVDGTNFPDVITISSLASQKRAPILLTEPASLNKTTETTVNDWKIDDVTIGGSYNSVSQNVENSLSGKSVVRYGGADRYKTAELIGEQVRIESGNKTDMILVDGTDFPDGITVNSLAGRYGSPIMLTQPTTLNSISADKIGTWSIKNVLIAGGVKSISQEIEDSLPSHGIVNKERVAGADRYQTAVKISERYSKSGKLGGMK